VLAASIIAARRRRRHAGDAGAGKPGRLSAAARLATRRSCSAPSARPPDRPTRLRRTPPCPALRHLPATATCRRGAEGDLPEDAAVIIDGADERRSC
jgi:hypothetical protein